MFEVRIVAVAVGAEARHAGLGQNLVVVQVVQRHVGRHGVVVPAQHVVDLRLHAQIVAHPGDAAVLRLGDGRRTSARRTADVPAGRPAGGVRVDARLADAVAAGEQLRSVFEFLLAEAAGEELVGDLLRLIHAAVEGLVSVRRVRHDCQTIPRHDDENDQII